MQAHLQGRPQFHHAPTRQNISYPLVLFALMLVFTLAACAPTAEGPFTDYYVSTTGSNSTGNGSEGRPWQTIQHALDNADYASDSVHIHVAAGRYPENLVITQSVLVTGAASGDPLTDSGVTLVVPDTTGIPGRAPFHSIAGDMHVELRDLTFELGRVGVTGASIIVENVWFNRIQGLFGLSLTDAGAFSVINSTFRTGTRVYADLGVQVNNSTGEIIGGYFGDWLDHPITIARFPDAPPMAVTVDGVTINGSPICYADGIRISGAPTVTIQNSVIGRSHADAETWSSCTDGSSIFSDGIAAGIGFQRVPISGGVIASFVRNNTISGFDVGLAFDARRTHVVVEGNTISGVSNGVKAWRWPDATSSTGAVLDFGRGPLGSTGGNTFPDVGSFAFYLDEDYDVSACDNVWTVPEPQVDPDRIFDELDDATRGRVFWDCPLAPIEAGPTEGLVQIITDTPTPAPDFTVIITDNARCRTGPGFTYLDYDFFAEGDTTTLMGRNAASDWFLVEAKNFDGQCWIGRGVLDTSPVTDLLLSLPELTPPPTPVPTATHTPVPPAAPGDNNPPPPDQGGSTTPPAAPANAYVANQTCNSNEYKVKLAWFDAADNEEGYNIYRDGNLLVTLGANSQEYADNPPFGGPYNYTIEAYNSAGAAQTTTQDPGCLP